MARHIKDLAQMMPNRPASPYCQRTAGQAVYIICELGLRGHAQVEWVNDIAISKASLLPFSFDRSKGYVGGLRARNHQMNRVYFDTINLSKLSKTGLDNLFILRNKFISGTFVGEPMKRMLSSVALVLLIVGALVPAASLAAQDHASRASTSDSASLSQMYSWPMFAGGSQRQGCSPSRGPLDSTMSWRATALGKAGMDSHGVSVADDKVFLGMGQQVEALNAATGNVIWTFKVDAGSVTTVPFVYGGMVLVGVTWGDGTLYALNASSGREIWRRVVGDMYTTAPLGVGDMIYTATNWNGVFGLSLADGSVKWSQDLPTYMHSSLAYNDGMLYGFGEGELWAVDVSNWRVEWQSRASGTSGSSVVYYEGTLLLHTPGMLECFSAQSGQSIWKQTLTETTWNAVHSTPVAVSGNVFVGTQKTNTLYCFNTTTGNRLWTQKFDYDLIMTPAASRNGMLYVPADGLWAVDCAGGQKLWNVKPGGNSPAIANGCVFMLASPDAYCIGTYTEDRAPPSVSILAPLEGACEGSASANISGISSDDREVDIVEASTDGIHWSLMKGNSTWNGTVALVPGTNLVSVRAIDVAGKTAVRTVNITMDIIPPQLTILYPPQDVMLNDPSLNISGTAGDNFGIKMVEVGLNRKAWKSAVGKSNWNATILLPEGASTMYVRVTDAAGNTFTAGVNLTLDTQLPVLQLLDPIPGSTLKDIPVKLTGTVTDNLGVSSMELSDDGTNWMPCEVKGSWTGCLILKKGPNLISLRATDVAGNVKTEDVSLIVKTPQPEPKPVPSWPGPLLPLMVLIAGAAAAGVLFAAGARRYPVSRPARQARDRAQYQQVPQQYQMPVQEYDDPPEYQPPQQYQVPPQYQGQQQYPSPQQYQVPPQYQVPQQNMAHPPGSIPVQAPSQQVAPDGQPQRTRLVPVLMDSEEDILDADNDPGRQEGR